MKSNPQKNNLYFFQLILSTATKWDSSQKKNAESVPWKMKVLGPPNMGYNP